MSSLHFIIWQVSAIIFVSSMLNMGNCGLERLHGSSRRHSFWVAEMGLHPRLNSGSKLLAQDAELVGTVARRLPGGCWGTEAAPQQTHRMVQVEGRDGKRRLEERCEQRVYSLEHSGTVYIELRVQGKNRGTHSQAWLGKSCPQEVNIFLGNIRLWANKWQDKDCILSVLLADVGENRNDCNIEEEA